MKRSSRLRGAAKLSESVHQHLNMYAIAASAAGRDTGLATIS
jgi:hypothetical protein